MMEYDAIERSGVTMILQGHTEWSARTGRHGTAPYAAA